MKRVLTIVLSILLLFSAVACNYTNKTHDRENDEQSENYIENTQIDNYEFISAEEKASWRHRLINILSNCEKYAPEFGCYGSYAAAIMDLNFDNTPEVILASYGGSMCNIPLQIFDLNSGEMLGTYIASQYGPDNVYLCVAKKDGKYVILRDGSIRITADEFHRSIGILKVNEDTKSNYLISESILSSSTENGTETYMVNGIRADKEFYDEQYDQFLFEYKTIDQTAMQLFKWSDYGELEWKDFGIKEGIDPESHRILAEKMADALISSSQEFIKYKTIDPPAHANPDHFANFSSYDEIIRTYTAIVKCFSYYSVEKYERGEYTSTLDFPSGDIEETYKKVFFSAFYYYEKDYAVEYLEDGRNYFGYALYDINNNGSEELILLNDHYDIIAIFSNASGTPHLIIDSEPYCRIDANGRIVTQKQFRKTNTLFPGYDYYYDFKVYTLSATDEIALTEEYQAANPFYNDGIYYDITNGTSTEISRQDFISKTHGFLYNNDAARITQSSIDLDFVRLFDAIEPQLPEPYVWTWRESKYTSSPLVTVNLMTEKEIYLGFYSSDSPWTHVANVTATRCGESAYFESETLSGRIDFGLDCLWVVITKSNSEAFPCGAYIYKYHDVQK